MNVWNTLKHILYYYLTICLFPFRVTGLVSDTLSARERFFSLLSLTLDKEQILSPHDPLIICPHPPYTLPLTTEPYFISPEVKVAYTHSKVRAILRRIFNSGVLHARLLIEKTCTRHNLKERVSGMNQISITLHTFLGTEKIT